MICLDGVLKKRQVQGEIFEAWCPSTRVFQHIHNEITGKEAVCDGEGLPGRRRTGAADSLYRSETMEMEAKKIETVLAGPAWAPYIVANGGAVSEPAINCPGGILSRTLTKLRRWLGISSHIVRLTYEREQLRQQNRAYQAEFGRMRQSEAQVRALRHDMKNHLAVLEGYAARGQTEELVQYLKRLDQQLSCPGLVHTGNLELDSILNYKLGWAKQAGARMKLDVRLPEGFTADMFDLNVILGNLLDNAVEGLERSEAKELSLSLTADRGVLFLKIVNSYDGVLLRAAGPEVPAYRSRKTEEGHGLGLSIVRRAVDKYHGALWIDSAGTIFSVEVMLYLEE